MSPQNEFVEKVKEMMAEVTSGKNELVERLDAMHQQIAAEEDPVTKVRRKVEWAAEKERSLESSNKIVESLQCALEEEDRSTTGSTASIWSTSSVAASHPDEAFSHSFAKEHASSADRIKADFESTAAANIEPDFSFERCSSAPLHTPATCHHRRLLARLDQDGEPASSPVSKAAEILRSLSSASQLPQQVRKSLRNRARKFAASFFRKVGWNPALQEIKWAWDYSI